jgi:hypothetical protein
VQLRVAEPWIPAFAGIAAKKAWCELAFGFGHSVPLWTTVREANI